MVTQDRIKHIFDYDHEGFLIWKNPPTNRTKAGKRAIVINSNGYSQTSVDRKLYLTHRLIYLWHYGHIPKQIDHINRNRADNRIENLRDAKGFNNANRTKSSGKSSEYRGVTWDKAKKKWQATCKEKLIGRFDSEKEAALAYNAKAIELFGDYAHLNAL